MLDSYADFESSAKDEAMTFKRTNRHGFLLGFIDFFTAGLFFLLYMPLGGLQDELEYILNHKMIPYWKAYLLGIRRCSSTHWCGWRGSRKN